MFAASDEPFVGGNITGPAMNATIFGGAAFPTVYNNQTIEAPSLIMYGNTTDQVPFIARGEGIGLVTDQIARIVSLLGSKVLHVLNILFIDAGCRWAIRVSCKFVHSFRVPTQQGTYYRHRTRLQSCANKICVIVVLITRS